MKLYCIVPQQNKSKPLQLKILMNGINKVVGKASGTNMSYCWMAPYKRAVLKMKLVHMLTDKTIIHSLSATLVAWIPIKTPRIPAQRHKSIHLKSLLQTCCGNTPVRQFMGIMSSRTNHVHVLM